MERFHGHFLNWYDTTTLRPLPPAYVSTVDSGNLLACLLAIKNGLLATGDEPVPASGTADGLLDAVNLAAETLPAGTTDALRAHLAVVPADLVAWDDWLEHTDKLAKELPAADGEASFWMRVVTEQIRGLRDE